AMFPGGQKRTRDGSLRTPFLGCLASAYDLRLCGATFPTENSSPLKKKSPALTLPQAALMMKVVLPARMFDKKYVLEILRYYQKRNWVAKCSHAKSQPERSKKVRL
ncbi:MAG: hypothetical protein Q8O90_12410, partial [Elusimicrobiota bacterium]|nr:hypothetical protein [Elusimicrobiota bacterium]